MGLEPNLEHDQGSTLSKAHNFRSGFTDKATERQKEPQLPCQKTWVGALACPCICLTWRDPLPTLDIHVPPE